MGWVKSELNCGVSLGGDIFKIWVWTKENEGKKRDRKVGYARGFVSVQAQDVSGSVRFYIYAGVSAGRLFAEVF